MELEKEYSPQHIESELNEKGEEPPRAGFRIFFVEDSHKREGEEDVNDCPDWRKNPVGRGEEGLIERLIPPWCMGARKYGAKPTNAEGDDNRTDELKYPFHRDRKEARFDSGCRESNPVYKHPMLAYYRYTTARQKHNRTCVTHVRNFSVRVGLLGIEPSLHAPEACVLPVYYSPC